MGDGESPSSSRLIAVLALLSIYLVPVAVWAIQSFRSDHLAEVPGSVLGFIGTVSGPLLAFVHANKRLEEAKTP